jgi:hypothetical protein
MLLNLGSAQNVFPDICKLLYRRNCLYLLFKLFKRHKPLTLEQMKIFNLLVITMMAVLLSCNQSPETRQSEPERLLRHVVLFNFTDTATADEIRAVEEKFAALPGEIDEIHDFEWGRDIDVSNIARGYTHCFLVTFKTEADLDAYGPHPAHQEFVSLVQPILENVLVIDYWTE